MSSKSSRLEQSGRARRRPGSENSTGNRGSRKRMVIGRLSLAHQGPSRILPLGFPSAFVHSRRIIPCREIHSFSSAIHRFRPSPSRCLHHTSSNRRPGSTAFPDLCLELSPFPPQSTENLNLPAPILPVPPLTKRMKRKAWSHSSRSS